MNRRTDWTPIQWAEFACDTLMAQYVPEELPPAYRWHYHQGVFLCGMEEVLEHSGDERYEQYIKRYVDKLIDAEGNFYFARDELDAIQPGLLLFRLAEKYKEISAIALRLASCVIYSIRSIRRAREATGIRINIRTICGWMGYIWAAYLL